METIYDDDSSEDDVYDAMCVLAQVITLANRVHVFRMGAVSAILKGMFLFPDSGRISSIGCDALFNEIRDVGDETTVGVFNGGGGRAAVAALRDLGCESELVAKSALILIAEIAKDPSTCVHLEKFGGCIAVVQAVEAFGYDNKETAEIGCLVIARMARDDGCKIEMKFLLAGNMLDRLVQAHNGEEFGKLVNAARSAVGE